MSDINVENNNVDNDEGQTTDIDVSTILASEEGQKALRPFVDREVQKALKTYKEKTVPNLVQDNLKQALQGLFPDLKEEVGDPLQALSQKVDSIIEENNKSKAESFALQKAQELGIDSDVALSLIGDTTTETEKRLSVVAGLLKKQKESALEEYAKTNGRKVATSSGSPTELDALQQKLAEAEKEGNAPMVSAINRQISKLTNKEA